MLRILLATLAVLVSAATAHCEAVPTTSDKPRVLVLTDISNEPDDEESLVRFLVYSNEFDVEGLIAPRPLIVTTGQNGFTPGFTFSPQSPRRHQAVIFGALRTISNQPVTTYLWDFGDGSTGSGATPTHVYRRRGTYTVTAVLFSGVGSAFPGAGAAPIVTQRVTVS